MKEEERLGSSSKSSSSSYSSSSSKSLLPVSYGVDCEKYDFSSSVSSLSQPFSPESCVVENNLSNVFSLDHSDSIVILSRDTPCSCLYHVLEWILLRCCGCFC